MDHLMYGRSTDDQGTGIRRRHDTNSDAASCVLTIFLRQGTKRGLEMSWQKTKIMQVGAIQRPHRVNVD